MHQWTITELNPFTSFHCQLYSTLRDKNCYIRSYVVEFRQTQGGSFQGSSPGPLKDLSKISQGSLLLWDQGSFQRSLLAWFRVPPMIHDTKSPSKVVRKTTHSLPPTWITLNSTKLCTKLKMHSHLSRKNVFSRWWQLWWVIKDFPKYEGRQSSGRITSKTLNTLKELCTFKVAWTFCGVDYKWMWNASTHSIPIPTTLTLCTWLVKSATLYSKQHACHPTLKILRYYW